MTIQANFPAIKPSLLLDFANTKQLDPRITYTRASTATFYNGVTTAMAEQNLFTYSQDFDDAVWGKLGASVTANATTAPDGTTTADSLVSTATPASVYLTRTPTLTASQPYVMSFYVKANTANFIQIITASAIVPSGYVNFNVTSGAGAIGNYGGTGITPSIVDVGNGWYRCVLTIASVGASGVIEFHLVDSATAARSAIYSGTIGTGVYLWGSQLENRSAISAYTATTTQAITNYIPVLQTAASGVARFDHNPTTGESLGLLIEEAKTNLILRSDDFANASWTKSNCSIDSNTVVAPDGTLTGDKLVEDTSTGNHTVLQGATVSASTTYTVTTYAKAAGRNWLYILDNSNPNSVQAFFDLSTGTVGNVGGSATATITSVGNSWYRCSVTFATGPSQTSIVIHLRTASANGTTSYTGNGFSGLFLWGAQLEAIWFATSYIPTVASTVTRAADAATMTGTNFSSWFNVGQGTFYANASTEWVGGSVPQGGSRYFLNATTTTGSTFILYNNSLQSTISSYDGTNGVSTTVAAFSANNRFAMTYGNSVLQTAANGVSNSGTYNNLSYSGATSLLIGNSNLGGWIKKVAYYPIAVTSAQLQALTS
jgi:hypothetical protein